jgi:hypothetical protein
VWSEAVLAKLLLSESVRTMESLFLEPARAQYIIQMDGIDVQTSGLCHGADTYGVEND